MVHFIGNILTSHATAAKHPESDQEHFHITPAEALSIDATGLPVHLEHADNVKVGHVSRSWNDPSGTKWVLADIDTSTIEGKFVRNDLAASKPVYGSLSLQHIYTKYADGSTNKRGLEVSICKEPRRPGCNIVHSSTATDEGRYKVTNFKQRNMATTPAAPNTDPTPVAPAEESTAVPASAADALTPSTTQLMAEVVEASRQNDSLKAELEEKSAALAAVQEKERLVQQAAIQEQTQKAKELGDAVLEHIASLDPALAGEDTTRAITTLREKYPDEVRRVLEVACCASKHAKKLESELKAQKEDSERKLMEQAYHAAVSSSRPGCHGTSVDMAGLPEVEAVRASKRARTENPFAVQRVAASNGGTAIYSRNDTMDQIRDAYRGLKGSGNATDAMKSIADIIPQQRSRGFR